MGWWMGGIILDRGSRCVDVGLPVAYHPLRERDVTCKTRLAGWRCEWVGGWVVLYWIEGVDVWMYVSLLVAIHSLLKTLLAKHDWLSSRVSGWVDG